MNQNPHQPSEEPAGIDPEVGTERRTRIGGWWGDLFSSRVALAVMVLLWVALLVGVLLWFMYG